MPANQAVEALVHEYYKLVFHTIYGLTNSWEESQDLTQETFTQALRGIDAARAASGAQFHAKAWLLRIAVNTVRMQHRRRALFRFIPFSLMAERKQQDDGAASEQSAEAITEQAAPLQPPGYGAVAGNDPAELVVEQDAVQRALTRVPEPLRLCLLLSIVGGLSNAEIAATLELQEGAVRQRLKRARDQFRQAYERESGEALVEPMQNTTVQPRTPRPHRNATERAEQDKTQRLTLQTQPSMTWRSYV